MRPSSIRWTRALGAASFLALTVLSASASTLYVNGTCGDDAWSGSNPNCESPIGPKKTIQAALAAARHYDTILVADGTYKGAGNKNLDFGGKLVTLRSENGPDTCVIDCEGSGRGFYFHNGEGADAVLEGLTITNGYVSGADRGGAIRCDSSAPTIRDCTIRANHAPGGGGIYCYSGAQPTIVDCTIEGNEAMSGGGIYCKSSTGATIHRCAITNNHAWAGYLGKAQGGGIFTDSPDKVIDCEISGNAAHPHYLASDDVAGGGIFCHSGATWIVNCTITANEAPRGGGICCDWNQCKIVNCVIAGNTASYGAGVNCGTSCSALIRNCSITSNAARKNGGAVRLKDCQATIGNCVLWADTAASGGPELALCGNSQLTVSFSEVDGGQGKAYKENGSTLTWGSGNISANPIFVAPGLGDCHLYPTSPCIDAGDNEAIPLDELDLDGDGDTSEPMPYDRDGRRRVAVVGDGTPPVVDMGAYEFPRAGDPNCDGYVDFGDISPFVLALSSPEAYALRYPSCDGMAADCNGDGQVDFDDINPFVALLARGSP